MPGCSSLAAVSRLAGTAWLDGAAGHVARWTRGGDGLGGPRARRLRRARAAPSGGSRTRRCARITTAGDVFNLLFFVVALGTLGAGYVARPSGSADALGIAIGILSWDSGVRVPRVLAAGLIATAALAAYIPLTHMSHFIGEVLHLPRGPVGRCPARRQPEDVGRARGLPRTPADVGRAAHEGRWPLHMGRHRHDEPDRRGRPMTRRTQDARTWHGGIRSRCSASIPPSCRRCPPSPRRLRGRRHPHGRMSDADGYALDGTRVAGASQPDDAGGRGRPGSRLPVGPGEALLAREQLDVPAAAAAQHGALRALPDVFGGLPRLRVVRSARRSTGRPTAPRSSGASTSSTSRAAA